jgi:hypothetical protein
MMGEPSGTLQGKEQVGAYGRRALDRIPALHFEVPVVFVGVGSVAIGYQAVRGLLACGGFCSNG